MDIEALMMACAKGRFVLVGLPGLMEGTVCTKHQKKLLENWHLVLQSTCCERQNAAF